MMNNLCRGCVSLCGSGRSNKARGFSPPHWSEYPGGGLGFQNKLNLSGKGTLWKERGKYYNPKVLSFIIFFPTVAKNCIFYAEETLVSFYSPFINKCFNKLLLNSLHLKIEVCFSY